MERYSIFRHCKVKLYLASKLMKNVLLLLGKCRSKYSKVQFHTHQVGHNLKNKKEGKITSIGKDVDKL
jgi:hypothetical protein